MAKSISMDELFTVYKSLPKSALIVDVRTPDEFAEGHVPGSKNFPVQEIEQHVGELKKFDQLYVYCRSGGRVGTATEILEGAGHQGLNSVLKGGFPNWAARGYEIEFD